MEPRSSRESGERPTAGLLGTYKRQEARRSASRIAELYRVRFEGGRFSVETSIGSLALSA